MGGLRQTSPQAIYYSPGSIPLSARGKRLPDMPGFFRVKELNFAAVTRARSVIHFFPFNSCPTARSRTEPEWQIMSKKQSNIE